MPSSKTCFPLTCQQLVVDDSICCFSNQNQIFQCLLKRKGVRWGYILVYFFTVENKKKQTKDALFAKLNPYSTALNSWLGLLPLQYYMTLPQNQSLIQGDGRETTTCRRRRNFPEIKPFDSSIVLLTFVQI